MSFGNDHHPHWTHASSWHNCRCMKWAQETNRGWLGGWGVGGGDGYMCSIYGNCERKVIPRNLAVLSASAASCILLSCKRSVVLTFPQEESFKSPGTNRATYLLQAANAAIQLQARTRLMLRGRSRRKATSEGEQLAIREFLGRNFYKFMLEEGLLPSSETVEVCTNHQVLPRAERLVASFREEGMCTSKWRQHGIILKSCHGNF